MEGLTANLTASAALLAFLHVVAGPDHILPFVMLAKAQGWSRKKTAAVTLACGVGHVLSSLLLGLLGLALGASLGRIAAFEEVRGSVAAWGLVAFGLAYAIWGLRKAFMKRKQVAVHAHGSKVHIHAHGQQSHHHRQLEQSAVTFWTLFIIFAFGPCEPLIPLFVVPASRGLWEVALVTGVAFALVTLATMVTAVILVREGLLKASLGRLANWSHAMAGSVIAISGLAVIFLGL